MLNMHGKYLRDAGMESTEINGLKRTGVVESLCTVSNDRIKSKVF